MKSRTETHKYLSLSLSVVFIDLFLLFMSLNTVVWVPPRIAVVFEKGSERSRER